MDQQLIFEFHFVVDVGSVIGMTATDTNSSLRSCHPDEFLRRHRDNVNSSRARLNSLGPWYILRNRLQRISRKRLCAVLDNSSKSVASDENGRLSAPRATTSASLRCAMRARQVAKISQLRQALVDEGHRSLDQQAAILGLGRSTTWVILQRTHKLSGLRAATLHQMLMSGRLSAQVKRILEEYIEEKAAGAYGHTLAALRQFHGQLDRLGTLRRVKNHT